MTDPRIDHAKLAARLPAMKARCEAASKKPRYTDTEFTANARADLPDVIEHYEDLWKQLASWQLGCLFQNSDKPGSSMPLMDIAERLGEMLGNYDPKVPGGWITEILGDGVEAK